MKINLLSFISVVTATYFCMLIYQRINVSKHDEQNTWTILVLASLAWWNISDAFFYVAETKDTAWFWHRAGAIGWCGFIAVTAYYFLVMTGFNRKMRVWVKIIFWIPPFLLVLRFVLGGPTALAEDLVQSTSGMGWTYIQHFQTIWFFLYIAYLLTYMGGALAYLYIWQRNMKNHSVRRLSKGFVLLDSIVVLLGALSMLVIPYFTDFLPPAGCIATLIFGIWYWGWLRDYDFLHVELALNPGYILESCIDAMIVADDEQRILYANGEIQRLLGENYSSENTYMDYFTLESCGQICTFIDADCEKTVPLNLELKNGIPVLCSINKMYSRRRNFKVYILCMSEITQLKAAQEKLDYLAHYDVLTGLINRRRLNEILEKWKKEYETAGMDCELFFLDLSGFKWINDNYGHNVGDEALKATARALQKAVQPGDETARFAGDEFVILHKICGGKDIEKSLYEAVKQIDTSGFAPDFKMNVDIGRCRFSEAEDMNDLIRIADSRMYEKKKKRIKDVEFGNSN